MFASRETNEVVLATTPYVSPFNTTPDCVGILPLSNVSEITSTFVSYAVPPGITTVPSL